MTKTENKDVEEFEEKAVATVSLSVQVPAGDGKAMGEKWWREQPSMPQLLEKLGRAAEVFADPKAEDEESEEEKGVKAKERVVRNVESIFKKPHRAAWKLTLGERKWEEKNVAKQNELFNKDQQVDGEGPLDVPEKEKKRVRLTIGVKPGERQEKKKKVTKVGGRIEQRRGWGSAGITPATECGGDR